MITKGRVLFENKLRDGNVFSDRVPDSIMWESIVWQQSVHLLAAKYCIIAKVVKSIIGWQNSIVGQLSIRWQSTWEYYVTGLGHQLNTSHQPSIVEAQLLCDGKVLYPTYHPPILAAQKANLLKITESQKLNWIQIFNLPTFFWHPIQYNM